MSSEKKFSRITVSSDVEDDVVIHAGARFSAPELEDEERFESAEPTELAELAEPAEIVERAEIASSANARARAERSSRNDYRETTLEDLEAGKMSSMQKGIIVAAVVLIAAFVVYLLV